MAGLIKRETVDEVRARARIEEVVGQHVTLKTAGVGSMKGLCPFHDERTASFHVRPHVGRWHCFGCNQGGDVISFIQQIDALSFADAVEYLAGKYGVTVQYEAGSSTRKGMDTGTRARLLDAHRVAAQFYAEQLDTPGAAAGREFLTARSFDREAAETFGVGFAPTGWDNLMRHLRGRGFTEEELTASGLVSQGQRGIYDRFRGRLVWPIRDVTGEVIGFGARKLFDEDQGPKYLNTPETALYKKSQVLYGIDLARRAIAKEKKIVVVEGYTDVMAAHLSGVPYAVATCGTAFGGEHVRVVRRMLGDTSTIGGVQLSGGKSLGGEVIFTFDGDEAGRKAALRAFGEDERFFAQTFVAISPGGMDPCELRMSGGPQAVQSLVSARKPLFEFVIDSIMRSFDLDTAEGRVAAVRDVAPVVASIRDNALRSEYERRVAGHTGMSPREIRTMMQQSSGRQRTAAASSTASPPRLAASPRDPLARLEREMLAAVLQFPESVPAETFDALGSDTFTAAAARSVHDAIRAAGGVGALQEGESAAWVARVINEAPEQIKTVVSELVTVPLPQDRPEGIEDYVRGLVVKVVDVVLTRRIAEERSRLSRMETQGNTEDYQQILQDLLALEQHRRQLRAVM
ncbi:DNA primase [Micrococcales bacterium KH10]|nr:DNA primase [Micrococcales bacterium KH10]